MAQPTLAQLLDMSPNAPGGHAGGLSWEEKIIYLLSILASGQNPDLTLQTGAVDTELPAAVGLADGTSVPSTPTVGAVPILYNGGGYDRARSSNGLVDGGSGLGSLVTDARLFNGATWDRQRTPNVFKMANVAANGSNALWTPAAGKKFRLMRVWIGVTGQASLAAAANFAIIFQDAATTIPVGFDLYLPAASPNTPGDIFTSGWIDLGNGILSSTANNVLNVWLSAALATGAIRVFVAGTEE